MNKELKKIRMFRNVPTEGIYYRIQMLTVLFLSMYSFVSQAFKVSYNYYRSTTDIN